MMNDDFPTLDIYFIGSSIGESIVINLPNGLWGVVDCYSPSLKDPGKNPTLTFLREHSVNDLEFICLTHPHSDHYRGMSHILREMDSVKWWWQFDGLSGKELAMIVHYMRDSRNGSDGDELEAILTLVENHRKNNGLKKKYASDIKHLYPHRSNITANTFPNEVYIDAISPSSDSVADYYKELANCFNATGQLKKRLPPQRHNAVSMGLLIRYGNTHVILGGDVEFKNWTDTISALEVGNLAANCVKVSHHGSETGIVNGLWDEFSSVGKPISIITPFLRKGLPRLPIIRYIKSNSNQLLTTCLSAIQFLESKGFDKQREDGIKIFSGLNKCKCRSLKWKPNPGRGICALRFDDSGYYNYEINGDAGEIYEL